MWKLTLEINFMRALAFGEILWDIINGKAFLGGAPLNLSAHLAKMGAESVILSSVGNDDLGQRAAAQAESLGIDKEYISVLPDYPTGTVDVKVDEKGIPEYIIHENTAWDNITPEKQKLDRLLSGQWDVFCFGTLAQRDEGNRKLLKTLLSGGDFREVFYDINLRQDYYSREWIENSLDACMIAKLNDDEAAFLAKMLWNRKMEVEEFCVMLSGEYKVHTVIVTRGADGAAVYSAGEFREVPGIEVKVADTVGAGDSFSAGFLFAFLSGRTAAEAVGFAVRIGGFVASRSGAIPEYSDDIKLELKKLSNN